MKLLMILILSAAMFSGCSRSAKPEETLKLQKTQRKCLKAAPPQAPITPPTPEQWYSVLDAEGLGTGEVEGTQWYYLRVDNFTKVIDFISAQALYIQQVQAMVTYAQTAWTLCGDRK